MEKLANLNKTTLIVESYDFKYLALVDDAKQKIIEELKNQHPELTRFIANNTIAVDLYVKSTSASGYSKTGRVTDFVISNGTIELVYERNGYTRYVDLESAMTGADIYFGNLTRSMPTYKVLKAIKDIATALNRQHKDVVGLRDKKAYKALNDEVAKELKQHIRAIRYEIPMAEEYSAIDMPEVGQEDFEQWAEAAAENLNKIHENFFNLPFAKAAVEAGMVSDRQLFTEKGEPKDTNRNIAKEWHAIGKIIFDCTISQLTADAQEVIAAARPTGTANISNKKIIDCVRLANALIKYFNNDVSFFRDKHMNDTNIAESFKTKRQAMVLHEEFKLYETMWDSSNRKVLKTVKSNKLTESRSVAEIEAEIEKLKQELAKAKVAEKRAKGKLPVIVFAWDMYIDPADKGTWTSAELYKGEYEGMVFETKEKAIDAAVYHLSELEDEGELLDEDENPVDPDDYTIDTFVIGIEKVSDETLKASGLAHAAWEPCECAVCGARFKVSPETSFYRCSKCHTDLDIIHS
jgi:hypothetical protein